MIFDVLMEMIDFFQNLHLTGALKVLLLSEKAFNCLQIYLKAKSRNLCAEMKTIAAISISGD